MNTQPPDYDHDHNHSNDPQQPASPTPGHDKQQTDDGRPTSPRATLPLLIPLWNSEEGRPRTLWRLLVLILLFALFTMGLSLVIIPTLLIIAPNINNLSSWQSGGGPFVLLLLISTLATVLSMVLAALFLDRRPFVDYGFRMSKGWWLDCGFGLALGAVLMTGVFLVEWAAGWVTIREVFFVGQTGTPFIVAIMIPIVGYLCTGIYEEMLFRGYMLRNLSEGLNVRSIGPRRSILLAFLISSFLFGIAHALNPNATVASTTNIILAGVLLGAGYVLTGQLAIPIGLHITWNFFQGNVFGFPVSGSGVSETTFIAIEQGGPQVWSGGAFGPEGGVLGILASLAGIGATVLWVRFRYGQVALYEPLAHFARRARK